MEARGGAQARSRCATRRYGRGRLGRNAVIESAGRGRAIRRAGGREEVLGPAPVAEEVAQLVQRERPAGEEGCGPGPPAPRGHGPDGTPKSQRSMKAAELDERAMRSGTPSAPIARTEIT